MPWSASDYPKAMTNLSPKERTQAISIANAILKDGGDEGMAIATGIARAKEAAKGNKPSQGSTDSITAAFYEEVLSSHQETPDMATKKADIGTPIDDPNATPKMAEPGDDIVAPGDTNTDTPGDPREELEAELSNEATVQAVIEFLAEEGLTLDDATVSEGIWGWSETADCATIDLGSKDYMVFPNEDTAIEFAQALVRQDLDEQPEIFNQDWLSGHINEDALRDFLMSDMEEDVRQNPEVYGWDGKWVVKLTGPNGEEETLPETFESEDDAIDAGYDAQQERGEGWDYDPEQQDADEPDENWVEEKAKERLSDPIEYLKEIYDAGEAMKKAMEWGGIDIDAATDEAVATDGWQHFVSSYDGHSHDLPSGGVWVRHN